MERLAGRDTEVLNGAGPLVEQEVESDLPYTALHVMAALGFINASYLTLSKVLNKSLFCPIQGGCGGVLDSPYAYIQNIPISLLGMAGWGALALLSAVCLFKKGRGKIEKRLRPFVVAQSTIMASCSAYLMAILYTKLEGEVCPYCLSSAFLAFTFFSLTLFSLSKSDFKKNIAINSAVFAACLGGIYLTFNAQEAQAQKQSFMPFVDVPVDTESSLDAVKLAKELKAKGAKMYGAFWCFHCHEQKESFGQAAMVDFPYVECFPNGYYKGIKLPKECEEPKLKGFPTWVIGSKQYDGEQTLQELRDILDGKPPTPVEQPASPAKGIQAEKEKVASASVAEKAAAASTAGKTADKPADTKADQAAPPPAVAAAPAPPPPPPPAPAPTPGPVPTTAAATVATKPPEPPVEKAPEQVPEKPAATIASVPPQDQPPAPAAAKAVEAPPAPKQTPDTSSSNGATASAPAPPTAAPKPDVQLASNKETKGGAIQPSEDPDLDELEAGGEAFWAGGKGGQGAGMQPAGQETAVIAATPGVSDDDDLIDYLQKQGGVKLGQKQGPDSKRAALAAAVDTMKKIQDKDMTADKLESLFSNLDSSSQRALFVQLSIENQQLRSDVNSLRDQFSTFRSYIERLAGS